MQVHRDEGAERRPSPARGEARDYGADHQRSGQAVAVDVVELLVVVGCGEAERARGEVGNDAQAVEIGARPARTTRAWSRSVAWARSSAVHPTRK